MVAFFCSAVGSASAADGSRSTSASDNRMSLLLERSSLRINADLGAGGEHDARGPPAVHRGPLRAVERGPIDVELELAHREGVPLRVVHLVADQAPAAARAEAPRVFLEPV